MVPSSNHGPWWWWWWYSEQYTSSCETKLHSYSYDAAPHPAAHPSHSIRDAGSASLFFVVVLVTFHVSTTDRRPHTPPDQIEREKGRQSTTRERVLERGYSMIKFHVTRWSVPLSVRGLVFLYSPSSFCSSSHYTRFVWYSLVTTVVLISAEPFRDEAIQWLYEEGVPLSSYRETGYLVRCTRYLLFSDRLCSIPADTLLVTIDAHTAHTAHTQPKGSYTAAHRTDAQS